jgi:hypothetical protein
MRAWMSIALLALAIGCGGGEKKVSEPVDPVVEDDDTHGGDQMASQEILDSIRRTFERKSGIVGRCFVEGIDAGEVKKTDRGFVTIVAVITPAGRATDVKISEASLRSAAVHSCLIDMVGGWTFAEPPVDTPTSFRYVLEQL